MIVNGLTLRDLRNMSVRRLAYFKNSKGEPAHALRSGADWSPNDWMTAVVGEVGEAANILKKVRRQDLTLEAARPAIAEELADVLCYLILLAFRCGIDLEEATITKWNKVSERIGYDERLK